jgi:hypothetical protein
MPKRTRKTARKKGISRRKLAVGLAFLVVAVFVASFVSYGVINGANVNFTFGGENDVRQSYLLIAMSEAKASTIDITHVHLRNTGDSGITVIVTMHALNAAVSVGYYGPYSDSASIQTYVPSESGERVVTFYLTLPRQVQTFTISVTVGRMLDFSTISNLATTSLASIQPSTPTTLVYTQESASPINYQLTEQY